MKVKSSRLLAIAVAGTLGAVGNAFATNGSFMIGYGAGSIGMGGVGITSPQDSMCSGANPACLGEFLTPQFDVGGGLFDPRRRSGTTVMAGGDQVNPILNHSWSGVNTYLMPSMGFVFPFDDNLTLGFAALPAGGGGSTFNPNFFGCGADPDTGNTVCHKYLGAEILQLIVPITVSYKVDKVNVLGFSLVPARQRFAVQGLDAFSGFSLDPRHMTNKGHDYSNGLGVRLGWTGKFFDNRVTLGATYGSRVYMGKLQLYSGTLPNGGEMDIPANYGIGIGVKPSDELTFAFDVQKTEYSEVAGFGNKGPDANNLNIGTCNLSLPSSTTNCGATSLGGTRGPGFGWTDQTVYKLGAAYKYSDKLMLRAGYNYGKTPISPDQLLFSLLAPATTEKHITLGMTYGLGEQSIFGFGSEGAVTLAYMHAVRKTVEGPTVGTGGEKGTASMEMFQNSIDIAYTLKF